MILALALSGVAAAQASAPSFKADLLASMDDAAKKLVQLAEAEPAEKYGWRPAEGVRSISEVYMHVAGGNYFLPTFLGAKMPEGFDRGMEKKVTDKAQVVDWLKKSIAHVKSVVEGTPDAELDKMVKFFGGREASKRRVLFVIDNHLHEHLGQSIAYARSNGVTPPWSAGE
jgi:uncharacterized damage-inducible protein DinB